jgi:hypothetical protein
MMAEVPNHVSLATVAAFLVDEGWPCEQLGEQQILRTGFRGSHGEWTCYAHCRPEFDQCLFYSVAPVRAPEVLRPAVAEYLTRANWGLIIGNFEMDYNDGEVRFKTSIQLEKTDLTPDLMRPLVYGNVVVMDKYLPGLEAVIALTQTPNAAISAIEST